MHEHSVLFLDHSQVQPEQPYLSIHTAVLESIPLLFRECVSDPVLLQRCAQGDLKCLKRLVPVVTYKDVESIYAVHEAALWQHHFLTLHSAPWPRVPPSLRDSDPLLNSDFGLMLFSVCPNRATVQSFIEYLLAVDSRNRSFMERYVELVTDLPVKYELEDEKVEFEAGRLKCSRAHLAANSMYSLWRDVRIEDLHLLSLREDMQICD